MMWYLRLLTDMQVRWESLFKSRKQSSGEDQYLSSSVLGGALGGFLCIDGPPFQHSFKSTQCSCSIPLYQTGLSFLLVWVSPERGSDLRVLPWCRSSSVILLHGKNAKNWKTPPIIDQGHSYFITTSTYNINYYEYNQVFKMPYGSKRPCMNLAGEKIQTSNATFISLFAFPDRNYRVERWRSIV